MKTSSISLASITLVLCGLFAASSQSLQAQKKGLPIVPIVNDNANNNNNNNQNPPPAPVVKKAVPRRVVKTKVKVEAVTPVPKQMFPPVQRRVEQPKLPAGMKRMGPEAASNVLRNLAKLKLMPPMKRKKPATASSFPPIGETSLDKLDDRIRDIAFGQAANDLENLGDTVGFIDLIGGNGGDLVPDLGLGLGNNDTLEKANELIGDGKDDRFGGLGFFPDATAPQNQEGTAPKGASGAPIRPGDPADAAAGAAFTHPFFSSAGITNTGNMFFQDRRIYSNKTNVRSVWFDARGNVHVVIDVYPNDSDRSSRITSIYKDNMVTTTVTNYDENGEVTSATLPSTTRDPNAAPEGVDPDGNPDPDNADPDGKWARWWATNGSGRRPDLSMKTPNQVNPGDPDYEGAGVGRYPSIGAKFSGKIAVNPDPNMMSGGNRMPSERAWRLMQQDLINGATPGVNPGSNGGEGR